MLAASGGRDGRRGYGAPGHDNGGGHHSDGGDTSASNTRLADVSRSVWVDTGEYRPIGLFGRAPYTLYNIQTRCERTRSGSGE